MQPFLLHFAPLRIFCLQFGDAFIAAVTALGAYKPRRDLDDVRINTVKVVIMASLAFQ